MMVQPRRMRRTQRREYLLVAVVLFLLAGCQAGAEFDTAVPDCGDESGTIVSDRLEEPERGYPYDFQVYLPPCYAAEAERIYPVLYAIPGMGGSPRSWFAAGIQDIADELILAGEVPPFLIVSTDSTNADEPGGGLIPKELVPYVQETYRVHPERPYHSVAGASLGGIAAYRIAFQHPEYFASAGIFGSGVVDGEQDVLREWIAATEYEMMPRVFLNCGHEDPLMMERTLDTMAILDEADVEHASVFSEGGHDYGTWTANFAEYYRWMAQDWRS